MLILFAFSLKGKHESKPSKTNESHFIRQFIQ